MKKFLIFILTILCVFSSIPLINASATYEKAANLKMHADVYLLISADNDSVIFKKDADKQMAPASLTKIVTAGVVLDECKNLDEMVTVPEECITALEDTGSSMAGLVPGEELSVSDLLHAMLISSGNDAAMVLAYHFGDGDIDAFVAKMNALAEELGCNNSSFVNPHGLDDEYHFTTAYDLAKFTRHALEYPLFKEITKKIKYTLPATNLSNERDLVNTNKLMSPGISDYYCEYASGIKTGSTSIAGKCVVSTASKGGSNFIGIVMHAPEINIDDDSALENCAFVDCKAMFDWAIRNLDYVKIASEGKTVAQIPVTLSSKKDYVTVTPDRDYFEFVPSGTTEHGVVIKPVTDTLPETLEAPVKKGQVIGKAEIFYSDSVIATVDLVASEDIEKSPVLTVIEAVKSAATSTPFKVIAAIVLALIVVLVLLRLYNKSKKRRDTGLHVVTYRDFSNNNKRR